MVEDPSLTIEPEIILQKLLRVSRFDHNEPEARKEDVSRREAILEIYVDWKVCDGDVWLASRARLS
jgi:hypothetical protein